MFDLTFTIDAQDTTTPLTLAIDQLVIAGWTGRDPVARDKHIKELQVRAHVVHGLARLYIKRHIGDLNNKLLGRQVTDRIEKLEAHVERRMKDFYPEELYTRDEGALPRRSGDGQESRGATLDLLVPDHADHGGHKL